MAKYIEKKLYLLCRCTKQKYAEELFYHGILFFNYPINWIGMGEDGDEGQGDPYEGVYSDRRQRGQRQRGRISVS